MSAAAQIPTFSALQTARIQQYSNTFKKTISSRLALRCSSATRSVASLPLSLRPFRCAVLGAGFAGLSVAWHLLQLSPEELSLSVDLYDETGIGGGASGVAGGLLHPYSPKVKLLWKGAECWKESLKLLQVAEHAETLKELNAEEQETVHCSNLPLIRKRGILRPAVSSKNLKIMADNAQDSLASCAIECITKDGAEHLLPGIFLPLDVAFYMPKAINIHSQHYLEALYLACKNSVDNRPSSTVSHKELNFHKQSVGSLPEFAGDYDAVIICLGARTALLPEFSGKLPLRTCRGVVAHLQLASNGSEDYPDHSPSILSDAWLAVQGPRALHLGSTWEWKSTNYSRDVSVDEYSRALEELIPKASAVYPAIKNWTVNGAVGGLRAMPPITPYGSLPLVGCVDDFIGVNPTCKYWLFTGLGSRGLLYHAWLGKLLAQAVICCDEGLIPPELISWKQKTMPI